MQIRISQADGLIVRNVQSCFSRVYIEMRYLPTLEIDQQINQVAFPDIHAIELAEICLTKSGDSKRLGLQDLLLASPMLLFWAFEKWTHRPQEVNAVPISQEKLTQSLIDDLGQHAHQLVKDHFTPLTSVSRLGVDQFVEIQAFFDCRTENNQNTTEKILSRLAILQYRFFGKSGKNSLDRLKRLIRFDFDVDRTIADFDKTDFSQFADRSKIDGYWNLELPSFRDGLGILDEKIDRLTQLESEFEDLVQRGKISAMQQLAYGASHEINNPLANISTRAQALLRDETDPKRRQRLMTIDAQAFRAHDMISNLMTFAKPRRPEMVRFQLRPAVEAAVEKLSRIASEQQVEFCLECESSVYIEADPDQFGEVIYALSQNAIESIRSNGTVRIRCQAPELGQPILVEVMDTGPGVSPEIREHIFDPFFSGREAGRGLGFGLSKVWRLMELHLGSVRMVERDGYTIVELLFPAAQKISLPMDIEKTA